MSTDIAHFAINADDPEASLRFYEALFGWRFEPWGPPGFFRMERESGPVIALQQRRAPAHGTHGDPGRRRADLLRGPGRQRGRGDAVRP
jgi:predicted enzyme related to lactoylglutathione lyase